MLKVNAIKCSKCKDYIFSRHVHDFRVCSCYKPEDKEHFFIAIDGGREYLRMIGDGFDVYEVEINVTNKELIKDYLNETDKYGSFKEPDSTEYVLSCNKIE